MIFVRVWACREDTATGQRKARTDTTTITSCFLSRKPGNCCQSFFASAEVTEKVDLFHTVGFES